MQPVVVPLQVVAGDTFDLTIRARTLVDGASVPLELSDGEVLAVSLDWPKSRIVATTADATSPDRLAVVAGTDSTEFIRQFTPAETRRLLGQSVIWSFYRIPALGERRTYVTGAVQIVGPGQGAQGDAVLNVTVQDQTIIVDVAVPDAASYTDAREAIIRQDMATAIADSENFAAAAALLVG